MNERRPIPESDRERVYNRAGGKCENPRCRVVLKPVGSSKFHVDHIVPVVDGGTNEMSNYQALCRSCNLSKGAASIDYTGRARVVRRRSFSDRLRDVVGGRSEAPSESPATQSARKPVRPTWTEFLAPDGSRWATYIHDGRRVSGWYGIVDTAGGKQWRARPGDLPPGSLRLPSAASDNVRGF